MRPLLQGRDLLPVIAPILVGAVILGIWQITCTALAIPDYLFPAPTRIWHALMADWRTLLHALVGTLEVTLLAFALAVVCGSLIALVFVQSRLIEISLLPYAIMLQVTPIVAIAPLLLIYLSSSAAVLVVAFLVAFFPILANTTLGLSSADRNLRDLFQLYRANRWQELAWLRLPSALPYFLAGLRIGGGLALIGAIVAEIAAGTAGQGAGLAYRIIESGFRLNVARMFAALLLISAAGITIYLLLSALSYLLLRHWHESAHGRET